MDNNPTEKSAKDVDRQLTEGNLRAINHMKTCSASLILRNENANCRNQHVPATYHIGTVPETVGHAG